MASPGLTRGSPAGHDNGTHCHLAGVAALALLCACAQPPTISIDTPVTDGGTTAFADTVIGFGKSGVASSCNDQSAACGGTHKPCDADAVLGANDGIMWALGANDSVEVAFLCSVVVQHTTDGGDEAPSLKIWSAMAAGASAVVEVSFDGSNFTTLGPLDTPNKTFGLSPSNLDRVRFVRIVANASGGVSIDAVQAL